MKAFLIRISILRISFSALLKQYTLIKFKVYELEGGLIKILFLSDFCTIKWKIFYIFIRIEGCAHLKRTTARTIFGWCLNKTSAEACFKLVFNFGPSLGPECSCPRKIMQYMVNRKRLGCQINLQMTDYQCASASRVLMVILFQ